ncbi:ABC transporter substrate-binding protein [Acetobacterium tundrae]|uniref:ABC transporter substrate-binding protein n=1 Tax=Acetobacterium tundrae TaxID=132932 RepID=A0ABR6WKA4_9FIRM|nr:ABC transporter substrate-binding protein [Acetobacterium tundrae]MBC3796943.1 ABC transporter substrate-binding protein [Acetobacterium tundrae]
MKKYLMILSVMLICGMICCGCTGKTSDTGTLSVDAIYPFSEDYGATFANGLKLAASEINEQGGILNRNIEVNYVNDGDNTNTAVEVATMVAGNDDFPIVIGHRSTDDVLKVASIYQRNNKILFSPIIATSKINLSGNEGAYLCAPSENSMANEMVQSIVAQGISKVVFVHSPGNTYGKDYMQSFEEYATAAGIEIVDAVSYLPNLDYFRYYVKKWDSLGAQAIVSACTENDITTLFNDLDKTGNTRPIYISYDIEIQSYTIPQSTKNLIQVTSYFDNNAQAGPQADFIKAYKSAFGTDPDLPAAQAYFALHLAADAANKAQSLDVEEIKKVLADNSFDTLYGTVSFDKRLVSGIPVFQKTYVGNQLVKNNKPTVGGQSSE